MAGPERGAWEALWAPYDEDTYQQALSFVPEGAVVLDIGAGDLRFARRLAARARVVYAVERNRALLTGPVPANVRVVSADARADMGVVDGMLRINIGLEDPRDLIADLDQALTKVGL